MKLAHLDWSRIKKNLNLDDLPALQCVELVGDHGDSMMHPDILAILDSFNHVREVVLVTNGSIRNQHWWPKLAKFHNLTVIFSIDGLEDTNDLYRINADFEKIMSNAKSFIKAGGRAIWKFIVFKHNEHQIEIARSLAKDIGFHDFIAEASNRNFFQKDHQPVMINGVYQGRELEMASMLELRKNTPIIMMEKTAQESYDPPSCSWLNNGQIYIDHLGNLIPCCMTSGLMWRKDISGQLWQKIVGDMSSINLYDHTVHEVLASEFYQHRLRQSFASIKTVHHACIGNCSKTKANFG